MWWSYVPTQPPPGRGARALRTLLRYQYNESGWMSGLSYQAWILQLEREDHQWMSTDWQWQGWHNDDNWQQQQGSSTWAAQKSTSQDAVKPARAVEPVGDHQKVAKEPKPPSCPPPAHLLAAGSSGTSSSSSSLQNDLMNALLQHVVQQPETPDVATHGEQSQGSTIHPDEPMTVRPNPASPVSPHGVSCPMEPVTIDIPTSEDVEEARLVVELLHEVDFANLKDDLELKKHILQKAKYCFNKQ